MKPLLRTPFILSLALWLNACSDIPDAQFANRGAPESLLDISTETFTLPLDKAQGVDDLVAFLNHNQPTQATMQCVGKDKLCNAARKVLQQFRVPVAEQPSSGGNQVVLSYQQVTTRDCDPRYIDDSINPYNLQHLSFGCSNAANMAQQVSDKRQFLDPALLGPSDGSKIRQNYNEYIKIPEQKQGDSLLKSEKNQ